HYSTTTAPTSTYTLSLHDALPIWERCAPQFQKFRPPCPPLSEPHQPPPSFSPAPRRQCIAAESPGPRSPRESFSNWPVFPAARAPPESYGSRSPCRIRAAAALRMPLPPLVLPSPAQTPAPVCTAHRGNRISASPPNPHAPAAAPQVFASLSLLFPLPLAGFFPNSPSRDSRGDTQSAPRLFSRGALPRKSPPYPFQSSGVRPAHNQAAAAVARG